MAVDDPAQRWPIDGRPRALGFEGARLTIRVEDERGKIALDRLIAPQLRPLFAGAGASGARLDTLVDSFMDWAESGEAARPNGAKAAYYRPQGILPRYGSPATIDEIARIRGMDPALLAKIRPVLTTHFGSSGEFDRETATPLAIAVHKAGEDGVSEGDDLEAGRQPDIDTQRPDIAIAHEHSLVGRTLTVVVQARTPDGGAIERRTMIVLTGRSSPAYYVISQD